MVPSVDDRLASMIRAVQEVILPALQGQQGLAEEQAHMVLGHLHQLRSQFDLVPVYERTEREALAGLARGLADVAEGGPETLAAAERIGAETETFDDQSPAGYRASIERIGVAINDLITATHADGSAPFRNTLYRLVISHGRTAADRDRSWFQASGFEGPNAALRPVEEFA